MRTRFLPHFSLFHSLDEPERLSVVALNFMMETAEHQPVSTSEAIIGPERLALKFVDKVCGLNEFQPSPDLTSWDRYTSTYRATGCTVEIGFTC